MTKNFLSRSNEETREFARQFACTLQRGDAVALTGGLGAGKTQFTKGIADVFNVDADITSPTFTLLNIYTGTWRGEPIHLYHFDLYRLETIDELYNIGFDEYLYGDGISIIEWADRFADALPKHSRPVNIDIAGDTERLITIEGGLPISRATALTNAPNR
jgi:tRNA threonylcarbamoyladenosine biosynthesis protein TsaE